VCLCVYSDELLQSIVFRFLLPGVGGLLCELCGDQREIFPHLDPQVGFGDVWGCTVLIY
jgi:hypothetical protein